MASEQPESPATADESVEERDPPGEGARFPIVGVGASAGGLEALIQFLQPLPLDTGMAFVLVQHLDPEHESALAQILARSTSLPVNEIANDQPVEPDHVYVIPRDTNLSIERGVLKLQPRSKARVPHRPIDSFFESLSQDRGDRAIGVVLSGTGSDGTLGLEAIKAEGGITFAQDNSAKHDSMPKSAVAAGCVDLVLSPADMAKELARIAKHPYIAGQPLEHSSPLKDELGEDERSEATAHEDDDTPLPSGGPARGESPTAKKAQSQGVKQPRAGANRGEEAGGAEGGRDDRYKKILLLLHKHSGVDFTLYKSTTIRRRINRRVILSKHDTLAEYAAFLRGNAKELDTLFSDVLISVTSFFRNPEMFAALKRTVLPELLKQRSDDPLRCWVLGCSTGQEAYSIAISFVEAVEKAPQMRKLQIFATDLNEALLDKARHGLYAKTLAEDISPERLRRFFVEEDGGYRVNKMLREMVVFARQNLIADPPFSRMDLISCRNLLIYLEPSLQKRALPTFHYALKPGGFLLLGASESVGGFTDLFEPVDKKYKIFSRKASLTSAHQLPVPRGPGEYAPPIQSVLPVRKSQRPELPESMRGELDAQREADRITINQFGPPAVLVNAELQILQFRGPTGGYLEPPSGKASFDVLKMARGDLKLPLRAVINQARKENGTARKENVRFDQNGTTRTVNLEVIPLRKLQDRCLLILFEDAQKSRRRGPFREKPATPPLAKKQETTRIAELESDLSETREYLQSMQEQHEAANEELQAANEEVQSANEELQSVNEELETSKEELESSNEELRTVNDEMTSRNLELHRLNGDLVNLQASIHLAILLVGRDLNIRRFSPQARKLFDLVAADVGRPIGHVRHGLTLAPASGASAGENRDAPLDLESLAAQVIADVRELELDVRKKGESWKWYSMRLRPYRTPEDNTVDGVVVVVVDITERKRAEEAVHESEERLRTLAEALQESVTGLAEADRRKTEFLATLAHELRNPLTPIRYALEVMRLSPGNGEANRTASAMMDRQVDQMVRLVDDLLDMSRISRGKIELRTGLVELTPIVQAAAEAARPACARKDIEISIALPSQPVILRADPIRLIQVLGNLLNNACKFTDRGGRVGLSVERDGGEAIIRVRDTGIGIAAENLPRVFDMFMQADSSLERSAGGLGIGLTLVKDLVEQHGGTVQAHSAGAGQGTEIVVRLQIMAETAAPPAAEESAGTSAIPPLRILIVDDNRDSATSMAMLLGKLGHETRTGYDGLEAVTAAEEFKPDLAILDIGMPKLNGYDAARRIREQPWSRGMVLVAMTGWGKDEDRQKSKEAGFDVHLVKPIAYAALTEFLGSLPSGSGERATPAAATLEREVADIRSDR